MQYRRSIGVMRQDDWQELMNMLNHYLQYVQNDPASSNDQINDIKLLIHKLQHHIDLPPQRTYSFNRWS
ncbi:hypothetical protein [Acinetobacter puyangensis]|uniref:hypothetical protein n=1 Tax=Acinetobacter puyangensis TaxID=1096779 RepID=UPI003A4DFF0A